MFIHGFMLKWKPEATATDKARVRSQLLTFPERFAGLLEVHVGDNISERGGGYGFTAVMFFESYEAVQAYLPHPAHIQFVEIVMPLADAAIDFDLDPQSAKAS